jgi:hypothetical protein
MEMQLSQQQGWRATKKAMTRAASAMAMAMKRAMVTNGANVGFTNKKFLAFEDG